MTVGSWRPSSGQYEPQEQTENETETALKELRDYRITPQLRDFASREGISFYIVADDLDKHWRPRTQQSIEMLTGLMDEADHLQRFFGDRLKVVMFLREDIFDVLAHADEDLPKRSYWRMEWTAPNLKHLVAARLAMGTDNEDEDDDTIWSAVFPDTVDGIKSSEYILSPPWNGHGQVHTVARPATAKGRTGILPSSDRPSPTKRPSGSLGTGYL